MLYRIYHRIINLYGRYKVKTLYRSRIERKGKVRVYGVPALAFAADGRVVIGDGVTLNSSNRSYHMNMFAPVKLMADRKGAVIEIGARTRIHGSCLHAYKRITIGENCLIAANCQIIDGPGHDLSFNDPANRLNTMGDAQPITIGDNVWIAAGCMIMPGVTIGEGSVIAAGSIVTKDIPPMCLAGGAPARVIKTYERDHGTDRTD